jgi:hypothetical protein
MSTFRPVTMMKTSTIGIAKINGEPKSGLANPDSFGMLSMPPQDLGCSSPTPDEYIQSSYNKANARSLCSPPPPPTQGTGTTSNNAKVIGPSPESMLVQLNTGRSILHPKPGDADRISIVLSMKLAKEVLGESDGNSACHSHIAIPQSMFLSPPPSYQVPSPNYKDDDEELEEDMPVMHTPIKLRMRTSSSSPKRQRPPSSSPRINVKYHVGTNFFVPISQDEAED